MNKVEKVQKAIDYIENNLCDNILLTDVSENSYCSLYHLHRLFRETTGYSLKEYIRSRRLSNAATKILCSGNNIVHIAMDSNYQNHESFTRAFKKQYGINPQKFKMNANKFVNFEKINLIDTHFTDYYGNKRENFNLLTSNSIKVIGIELDISHIAGANFEISRQFLIRFFKGHEYKKIPNQIESQHYIGVISNNYMQPNSYTFFLGAEVSTLEEIPNGFVGKEIKPSKYVVSRATAGVSNNVEDIWYEMERWKFRNDISSRSTIGIVYYNKNSDLDILLRKTHFIQVDDNKWQDFSTVGRRGDIFNMNLHLSILDTDILEIR